jgi:FKBP-type peptidyl-prolyl cis-trans isomerase SlpA
MHASLFARKSRLNRVQPGSFLTLHYRLRGPEGEPFVDTFGSQPATLSLGNGELAPAMEARLLGLPEGSRESFSLAPGDAFGERNPELLQRVRRSLLEEHGDAEQDYRVGDVVSFPTPDGQGSFAGVVREVAADTLVFDFNHPLAGRSVTFDVELIGIL